MAVDGTLRRALGVQFVLDSLRPDTPYGAARQRQPKLYGPGEKAELEREWRNVGRAARGLAERPDAYARLRRVMHTMRDIRGTLSRIAGDEPLTEVELFEVKRFLLQLAEVCPQLAALDAGFEGICLTEEAQALSLLDPGGTRAAGFSVPAEKGSALHRVRGEKHAMERALRQHPQESPEREALLAKRRVLAAQEEAENLSARLALTHALRPHRKALVHNTEQLGALDFTIAKAEWARRHHAVMPTIAEDGLRFEGLINPEIGAALSQKGRAFTPVTLAAPVGATVITGANMGGKSVALRTVVQAVLLCQMGFFAQANVASLPLFAEIRFIGGDLADTAGGLSSFGAEVTAIQEALSTVGSGALCLIALDEPARGTNPEEGAALAKALAKVLSRAGSVTLMATHFDGVAEHASAHYRAAGLAELPEVLPAGDPLPLIAKHMNYGLTPAPKDAPPPREALKVARLLGLAPEVVEEMAASLSKTLE